MAAAELGVVKSPSSVLGVACTGTRIAAGFAFLLGYTPLLPACNNLHQSNKPDCGSAQVGLGIAWVAHLRQQTKGNAADNLAPG